ncbi:ABC transporter ATP-binding protein [Lacticaseibacillus jixiensis]|uniref:ABC transporter ATP-binding protein n=1 Tax=Lacticaseibacillus jixiensis TaxID=3231926 RepID=UPI0036F37F91
MNALTLAHVDQFFGTGTARVQVLHDVSFEAAAGEVSLILGPSGSGKSTLLTIAGGLLTPTTGSVSVAGMDLGNAAAKVREQLRLTQIGFILQAYHLLPFLTVADQFKLVDKVKPQGNLPQATLKQLLEQLGLSDLLKHYPAELSGGQQQRVAIARALYPDPAVVLADEPTAALDSKRVMQVGQLLAQLAHEQHKAVVIVTHDERLTEMADHVYQLIDGVLKPA